RLRQRTRRVVRPGTAALLSGLQEDAAGGNRYGVGVLVEIELRDAAPERGEKFIHRSCGLQLLNGFASDLAGGVFFQPFWAVGGLLREQVFEVDDEVVGAEANGDTVGGFDRETHHGFVD